MARAWTFTELQFLREHAGCPAAWVGAQLGKSENAVRHARKRYRLTRPVLTFAACREELAELHALGLSDEVIALRLGVALSTAWKWRNKLGLPGNGWSDQMRRRQGERTARSNRRRKGQRSPQDRGHVWLATTCRAVHTDEQVAFLKAVDAWTRRHGRKPTLLEGYRIAVEQLGYRRAEP